MLNHTWNFHWFGEYCFFLLMCFRDFQPSTDVPRKFEPTDIFPKTFPWVKKKWWKKIFLRVQYVRVWVFPKIKIRNFRLPTSFQDFCLPTLIGELPDIFLKIREKQCTLVYNYFEFLENFSKILLFFFEF